MDCSPLGNMDAIKLQREYNAGRRNFQGEDLRAADLSHLNLQGIDLQQATLFGANLANTQLTHANLAQANLQSANLQNADLRRTNLSNTNLRRANLLDADVRETDLNLASLSGATLPNGQLFSSSATIRAQQTSQPLTRAEVQRDLKKVARPSPAPKVILPPIERRNLRDFCRDLPWLSLSNLLLSYIGFGFCLLTSQAPLMSWLIVLLTPLLWGLNPNFLWLIPAVAMSVSLMLGGWNIMSLSIAGMILLITWGLIRVFSPAPSGNTSIDALWVTCMILCGIIGFLTMRLPVVVLIFALCTFALTTPENMHIKRYHKREILRIMLCTAALGLLPWLITHFSLGNNALL